MSSTTATARAPGLPGPHGDRAVTAPLDRQGGPSPVVLLSGALLGPAVDGDRYDGEFDGTPVFLGVGAEDTRIPTDRVRATATVFRALGADVTERVYEGAGHEVTDNEFEYVGRLLDDLVGG